MNKYVLPAITFVAGAAVGAAATFFVVKDKFAKIADEEIEQMRDYYWEKLDEIESPYEDEIEPNEEELNELARKHAEEIIEKAVYSGPISATQVSPKTEREVEPVMDKERPYVIPPEEYDELGYNTISLTYYADEVLADDHMNIIDDVDEIIGLDSLKHFGEYEDDSVFVRNDKLSTDYEILLDNKTFEELTKVE